MFKDHPVTGMCPLVPALEITDMFLVLLLQLLAINLKILPKLKTAYRLTIQISLLKKDRIRWSSGCLRVQVSSLYLR